VSLARRLWTVLEPVHAVVYFAPEARERYATIGLKGFWMGYFATRAAPLGQANPAVVRATFHGFHPAMVGRALPDAWARTTPEEAWAARQEVALAALRRLVDDGDGVDEALAIARSATEACQPQGRPLFAATAALPWPEDPVLGLWHAATLLREHRGDGHVAALVAAGIDGCQAHVTMSAVPREALQPNRGWSDDDWSAAIRALAGRDLRAIRAEVEAMTDTAAAAPWEAVGEEAAERLHALLLPLARRIVATGAMPVPNPMGVPAPA
jgi:hypothetical protein